MEAFFGLREWVRNMRERARKNERRSYELTPGLPEGLEEDILSGVVAEQFGGKIASVAHRHLSGWKSSGAYRMKIQTVDGAEIFMIYKNALYALQDIPALAGFPLLPGPPEYTIYSRAAGPLAEYLPTVYLAEEISPGRRYHYLLEDLVREYRMMKGADQKILVSCMLPRLHTALDEWSRENPDAPDLLRFGRSFSIALQEYALENLRRYSRKSRDHTLKKVLNSWPQIAETHLRAEFFAQPGQLIHGDSNFSNIHLSKANPEKFKVVDWEWAGLGSPYADLASLLKGSRAEIETQALDQFGAGGGFSSGDRHMAHRHYLWATLERGLLDAAFLSAQYLNSRHEAKFHLPDAISLALAGVHNRYVQLSAG
jgi:hypothetical protein